MCSGIEAASVAWHSLGWTPVGFSEIEPFPCAVLAHHFPKVTNYGDMSKFRDWSIRTGDIDLLVGGTPCQSFSVAGLRQGLNDPRGNLMLTFLAIAEHLKPKWILWENVPGVLSSNGGRDFASFLGALGQLGYGFAYRVLDAQWCRTHGHPRAVPQRRRRVFVVGCLGDQRSAAKVLFESESLQRYSAKGKATRQGTASDVEEGVGSGGAVIKDNATFTGTSFAQFAECDNISPLRAAGGDLGGGSESLIVGPICAVMAKQVSNYIVQANQLVPCWWDGDNTASTLTKSNANGAQRMPDKDNFGAVLQPMPVDSASPTLTAKMQGSTGWAPYNETAHLVPVLFENHPNDSRITGPHDVAPFCVSRYGTGGGNVPLVIPIMPQAMQAEGWRVGKENQDGRGNGLGVGKDGDPCPTLDRSAVPAVAYSFDSLASNSMKSSNPVSGCNMVDVAKCIDTSSPCPSKNQGGIAVAVVGQVDWRTTNNDAGQVSQTLKTDLAHQSGPCLAVAPTMQVRRLTPTECERLQGFPDGWTAIPWKKKLADDCPDGPRYKALGNSMAVNCMEWIGQRINAIQTQS